MKTASKSSRPTPPTAHIGELQYQESLADLYARTFPDVDPEPYMLIAALQRIAARVRLQSDTEIYQPAGYSIAHHRILVALAAVGPTTPTELARFTQVSPSSISSVMRTLRQKGHVTRDEPADDADGRVRIVRLTPEGEAATAELMRAMHGIEEAWAQTLPDGKRSALLSMLRRMSDQYDENAKTAAE